MAAVEARQVRPRLILLLGLLAPVWACWQPARAAEPLRALVLSGANNHDWRATTPEIVRELTACGRFAVDVTNDPGSLSAEDLARYDVLVDNYNGPEWSPPTRQAFLDYLSNGGGVVIIHAADNAFPGWAEFDSLIGVAWREGAGHGNAHRYVVTIDDPDHPVTRGVPHFLHTIDELYANLKWAAHTDARVIASAYSRPEERGTGKVEPMLLVNLWGRGRMFHTAMGHDNRSLIDPYHVLLLQRGAEWAATGRVTIPVPRDLPNDTLVGPADGGTDDMVKKWVALGLAVGLAQAVAQAQGPDARARELAAVVAGPDAAAAVTARQILIQIGLPAVGPLMDLLASADDALRTKLTNDLLMIAARAGIEPGGADKLVETVGPYTGSAHYQPQREAAVRMLGDSMSHAAAAVLEPLLADPVVGEKAIVAMGAVPGTAATRALTKIMPDVPTSTKVGVLNALAERHDPMATAVFVAYSDYADLQVAGAALTGLAGLSTPRAQEALLKVLAGTKDTAIQHAAAAAAIVQAERFARDHGSAADLSGLKAVLARPSGEGDTMGALATLGLVNNAEALAILEEHAAKGSPRVQVAAAAGIARMSIPEAALALERMLYSASDAPILAALTAIGDGGVTACADAIPSLLAHNKREISDAVRVAAAQTLGKLGSRGSHAGVRALAGAFEDASEAVRAAALRAGGPVGLALAATQPGDALEFATTLFQHATDERDKAAALRIAGCAASDVASESIRDEAAAFVKKALRSSTGQAAGAACDAAVALAGALAKTGKKDDAVALLVAVLKGLPVGPRSQVVLEKLRGLGAVTQVAVAQGFLPHWHVIGPFPNAGGNGGFDTVYAPEQGVDLAAKIDVEGKALAWQAVESTDIEGKVNLLPLLSPNGNVLAYAYTEVEAPKDMDAVLKVGSDDGVAVWLNGERLYGKNVPRALTVDDDVTNIHLKAGKNTILLKVIQGGGDWGYCVRLLGTDSFPVVKQ